MPRASVPAGSGAVGALQTNVPPAYLPPESLGGGMIGGVRKPPRVAVGAPATDPGAYSVDITSPSGLARTLGEDLANTGSMFDGLRAGIFGVNNEGGIPIISDIAHPFGRASDALLNKESGLLGKGNVLGDIMRTVPNVAGTIGKIPGAIGEYGGKLLEMVPTGPGPLTALNDRFDAVPDSTAKQATLAAIKADPSRESHLKFEFMRSYITDQQQISPQLYPEFAVPSATFADAITNLLAQSATLVRPFERVIAGATKATGMNRLQEIEAVEKGAVYTGKGIFGTGFLDFGGGKTSGNRPEEKLAYDKWANKTWTADQALDFLASTGQAGFAHDPGMQLAAQVALDPTVWGSVGASALSRFTLKSIGLVDYATARAVAGQPGQALLREVTPAVSLMRGAVEAGVPLSQRASGELIRLAILAAKREKTSLLNLSADGWETARAGVVEARGLAVQDVRRLVLRAEEQGRPTRAINVLGRIGQSEKASALVEAIGRKLYTPMQYGAFGRSARIVRLIVDPLQALGGPRVLDQATVDATAEAATRVGASAYGELAHNQVLSEFAKLDREIVARGGKSGLLDAQVQAFATYNSNALRQVLVRAHVGSTVTQGLGRELVGLQNVGELATTLTKNAPKDFPRLLKEWLARVRELNFDDAGRSNLADRMASQFGVLTREEWLANFEGKSTDYLSLLHASSFGKANEGLLTVLASARTSLGQSAFKELKLDRYFLMNRNTLTINGAEGIVKRLGEATDNAMAMQIIREAQDLYPQLYAVSVNASDIEGSIRRFGRYLGYLIEEDALPRQVLYNEIKKLPQVMQDWYARAKGSFTFGIRPEDDKLMGLVPDPDGGFIAAFEPWVDVVAASTPGFRPSVALKFNAAGMPLIGEPIGRAIDYMEAAARTLTAKVTSATITEAARSRFVALAVARHKGLSEADANKMFGGILDLAGVHRVSPRGLDAKDMWKAVDGLIPDSLKVGAGGIGKREVLNLVVDAFEGDLRFVGLTQKFTGRVKSLVARTGSNFVGQISEDIYQRIKFRNNPIFQLQERLEPIILNSQRGVNVTFGTKMTATDRRAMMQWRRMAETGLFRSSDIDQAEFSAMALFNGEMLNALGKATDNSPLRQVMDVGGAKRIGLMRTYEQTIARSMKEIYQTRLPGQWEKYANYFSAQAGTAMLSDEEIAIRLLNGNLMADVRVPSTIQNAAESLDAFKNVIAQGEMFRASTLGEIRPLNLDMMVGVIGLTPTGADAPITTARALRKALDSPQSGITIDRVKEVLALHGAHPDYIQRVERALKFNVDAFWRNVAQRFSADATEIKRLKTIMDKAAEMRGITTNDFLSQVFDVTQTGEQTIGNMGDLLAVLRPAKGVKGTPEMLLDQLAGVFESFLDPSAKETLLGAFETSLAQRIQASMTAGRVAESQALQKTLETLRGGVGGVRNDALRQAIRERVLGDATVKLSADTERAVQEFTKWARDAISGALGGDKAYGRLLERLKVLPTDAAVPYNETHRLLIDTIGHSMRKASEDAFRLQYFARERSWLERSINHPLFGIYPASYMYGKVLPELVRFIAKEPFGVRTGAVAYTFNDVQRSIAAQRELDGEFDAFMEDAGRSEVGWFLGYMIPALPWDIGSAFPAWMRDVARQGLDNQRRAELGLVQRPISLTRPVQKIGDITSLVRPFKQTMRPLEEVGDWLGMGQPTPAEAAPGAVLSSEIQGPVKGAEIGPVLATEMENLRRMLANQ